MNRISELLIAYRETNTLTQKVLAEQLSFFFPDFKALNTVTVSRWETGTTSPGLQKKKSILYFLTSKGCFFTPGECWDIVHQAYEDLYEPLSTVFTRNYQYLIGNFPEFKVDLSSLKDLKDFKYKKEHIEHIIDIETQTNVENYYTVTQEDLSALCEHPSTFAIVCERKKQHLGHFIMFKIKNNVAEEIVYHRKEEHSLTVDDLCRPDEKGTYYVHALYGKNPRIAALLNVKAYLHLFENLAFINNLAIFSSRADGVLLTQDYGIEQLANGRDETYGYEWYGLMSPVEDILFSDTVLKLIF